MSVSKRYIDLRELEEDISYHFEESDYNFKKFLEHSKEAEEHLAKFQEHQLERIQLINYMKAEYVDTY